MADSNVEAQLQAVTDVLVRELISLTPETMSDIQFEIVATEDGGADVGLLETHPDVVHVALSETIYAATSHYLPLVTKYVPGWCRSLITLQETSGQWNVRVDFDRN